jgi:S-DNA-T family DNA segregation ATPase FtsK/SpoIIIE
MATPTARKRPPAGGKPAGSSARRAFPPLEQRHLDLAGLALVGFGVFLVFVVYLDWDGGSAGRAIVDGLRWLVGAEHVLVPVLLVGLGALLTLRPVLPGMRPLRAGLICALAALALGLAAGTLGLGPDGERTAYWDEDFVKPRGGMAGEALYWGVASLFGALGAHVVAITLFVAGALLLTGATVAQLVQATTHSVSSTHRRLRDSAEDVRASVTRLREERPAPRARTATAPFEPVEWTAPEEAAPQPTPSKAKKKKPKAATLDQRGFWSGEERFPDFYGGAEKVLPDPEVEVEADPPSLEPAPSPPEDDEDRPDPPALTADEEDRPDLPALAEDAEEPGVTRAASAPDPTRLTPQGRYRPEVTDDPAFQWLTPDPRVLKRSSSEALRPDTSAQQEVSAKLVEALGHYGVLAEVIGMVAGPHITRYELRLAPGIKMNKVAQLKDDLAYALAASDIRILAPIPGKQAVGVEVPNARRRIVHLGDVHQEAPEGNSPLTIWLGKDVAGRAIGCDLAKMPHLLVAGTTGAGKSACINAMLSSILLRATPHEVKMVLVDPKQVELTHYDAIPHLLTPVITSPRKAATALANLVREMEQRYSYMALSRTRTLKEMNKVRERRGDPALPYILCVIDELADLMMVAPADVEDSIIRLAQKARAVGIHLVLATQSPRVDVITGMIKANVPSRIAFAVSSQTDSRVILDQNGAESLLGQGDMLFSPVGSSRLQRIQGAYIDEGEIEALTEAWRRQGEPEFREELLEEIAAEEEAAADGAEDGFDPDEDPLLDEAIRLVAEMQTASTSMLQRRLRLGYTRAGRLIDMLERRGVISGYEGSKPRQVLITEADVPRVLAALAERAGAGSAEPGERVAEAGEPTSL